MRYTPRWLSFPFLLGILLVLTACAALTITKSAETLSAVGEQFLASAKTVDDAYRAKLISEADYQKWRAFVPQFKLAYAQAAQALETARVAGEVTTPQQTADLIRRLKDQLLTFLLQVYAPAAKGVQ